MRLKAIPLIVGSAILLQQRAFGQSQLLVTPVVLIILQARSAAIMVEGLESGQPKARSAEIITIIENGIFSHLNRTRPLFIDKLLSKNP